MGWLRGSRWALAASILVGAGCAALRQPRPEERIVAARGLSLRALSASEGGKWEEAKALFEEALETCSIDVQTRRRYAEALWEHGDRQAALTQMHEAVRLSAHTPALLVAYGRMLLETHQVEKAHRVCRQAVERAPQMAEALALLGDIYLAQGKLEEALEVFHRALRVQPEFPQVRLAIAHIDLLRGRPLRCLATLSELQRHLPQGREPDEALWLEGLALKSLRRYHDAVERFAALEKRGAGGAELGRELADALWRAGEHDAAREVAARYGTSAVAGMPDVLRR